MKRTAIKGDQLPEEEIAFWIRMKNTPGREDSDRFYAQYRYLVRAWALKYHPFSKNRMEVEDLEGIGWEVLWDHAVRKFDPYRGIKFSTYAVYWLKQSMSRASNGERLVALPHSKILELIKLSQAIEAIQRREGHDDLPTIEELSDETGFPTKKVAALLPWLAETYSLDEPIKDGQTGSTLLHMVASDVSSPEDEACHSLQREDVRGLVRRLEPREQRVIEGRYGLDDGDAETLKVVAETLQMSREGVRHVQTRALRKLRELIEERNRLAAA